MLSKNYTKSANLDKLKIEIQNSQITIALDSISAMGGDITVTFKADIDAINEGLLDALVTAHINTASIPEAIKVSLDEKKTSGGITKMALYEPEGESATIATHDFTKKQTWYGKSVQVLNQSLTSSNNLVFTSPNTYWIDLTHGLMYDEDNVNVGGMYNPVIKVDGVVVTTGFSINYVTGAVIFTSATTGVVTASYYYATTSYYTLKPKAGKILAIRTAEVQFTTDVVISSPFVFEAWVNHPTYGMIPVPNSKICYKNFRDFITACNEGQGLIPKIGGELLNDVHVFPFNYARPKPIKSSHGVEIRVYIADHSQVSGEYATSTFYVTIETE